MFLFKELNYFNFVLILLLPYIKAACVYLCNADHSYCSLNISTQLAISSCILFVPNVRIYD